MFGVLVTLLFAVGMVGVGRFLIGRWSQDLDPAAELGVAGLIGLGAAGLLTLFVGLIPGGLGWGVIVMGALWVFGIALLAKNRIYQRFVPKLPEGNWRLAPLVLGVCGLFSLIGVLAPSDMLDWDSLAYHLAVPKLWLNAGHIYFIPSLHQSNFPDSIDALYVWGLTWGGQQGAKAFSLAILVFGLAAIFGLARARYGEKTAWWSALAFGTIPLVVWESGTAYIDVANGLFSGLGILFAASYVADRKSRDLWLCAATLGFAVGSKYTGLQTVFVVGVCLTIAGFLCPPKNVDGLKGAVLVGLVAVAIASPWYVKNVVNTGNPVYPFFSEKLGGRDWDQRRADIYRNEQQSFGVGRTEKGRDPMAIGHAVLGLAYQPGRYVNPQQTVGLGTPLGAVGMVALATLVLWAFSGKLGRFEGSSLAAVGLTFGMWFFLSQQSRYALALAVPLSVLTSGAIARLRLGPVLAVLIGLEAVITGYLVDTQRVTAQLQVVLGRVTDDQYQTASISFFEASKSINALPKQSKVALYDEVFGFLLDVPYMWANPGHGTLIPYDSMQNADDYVREMKKLGFTHVYINTSRLVKDKVFVSHWLASMGLPSEDKPLTDDDRKGLLDNFEVKWEVLLADAVAQGKLQPVHQFHSGFLFEIK